VGERETEREREQIEEEDERPEKRGIKRRQDGQRNRAKGSTVFIPRKESRNVKKSKR